jgi:hypothetical protein
MIELLWRFCGGVIPNLSQYHPAPFELIALEIKGSLSLVGECWGLYWAHNPTVTKLLSLLLVRFAILLRTVAGL